MSTVSLRKFLPKRNNDNNNVNPKETVNQMTSLKICLDTFCILRECQLALQLTIKYTSLSQILKIKIVLIINILVVAFLDCFVAFLDCLV